MDVTTIFKENEALIHHIIKKHYPQFIGTDKYEDAFQDGSIGLLKAIKGFNPELGHEFSTYAYPAIRSEIYKGYYKNNSNFSISRYANNIRMNYNSLIEEGYSFDEIVKKLNTTPATLLDTINAFENNDFLERKINHDPEGSTLRVKDSIKDEFNLEDYLEFNDTVEIAKILCNIFLSEEDIFMLNNFYSGIIQAKIGEKIGRDQVSISRRITRIEKTLFPYFKEYIEGDLKFGELCLKFIEKDRKTRLVLKCYLEYIFEIENHPSEFIHDLDHVIGDWSISTLKMITEFLGEDKHYLYQVKYELTDLVNVVDKYYSRGGIESIILKRLVTGNSIKSIEDVLGQVC